MNERIKELRKALGFTQHEFADRLGISRGNIGSYEVGKSNPGGSVITLICKTFNVSEEWLRTGEGEMFLPSPNGALDELTQKYGLSSRGKIIVEQFLELKPDVQEAMADYIEKVAAAFGDVGSSAPVSAPAFASTHTPTIEEEARAEAEEYYRQRLMEKKQGAISSASQSDTDNGTAKMA